MPKYVIEREIPGAGKMTPSDLKAAAQKSCAALEKLGTDIQWVHSYVTADRIYCVYNAANEEIVTKHANASGFPANRISQVFAIFDPTTSE
jgi:hypothetical protein